MQLIQLHEGRPLLKDTAAYLGSGCAVRDVTEIKETYWLPTRPYGIIDAVNRCAAATGSVRYAQLASHADYNGHHVSVYWNSYRRYWLAEYTWGERCVLQRGGLAECLKAAEELYRRGALGASARVHVVSKADREVVLAAGWQRCTPESEAEHRATYEDDRFALVSEALRDNRTHLLVAAKDAHHYRVLCDEADFGPCVERHYLVRDGQRMEWRVHVKPSRTRVFYQVLGQLQSGSGEARYMRKIWQEFVAQGWTWERLA